MQPIKRLSKWLLENGNEKHCLFRKSDLRVLFSDLSDGAYRALLSRAVDSGILIRMARGIYLYKPAYKPDGVLLYRVASLMRCNHFNYISLETALSDAGVISQIPINWIGIMSSGRSSIIKCGSFGTIEFVHTVQKPNDLVDQLIYDRLCGMWRAKVPLAIRDMKRTHRNLDLIDWDVANEFI